MKCFNLKTITNIGRINNRIKSHNVYSSTKKSHELFENNRLNQIIKERSQCNIHDSNCYYSTFSNNYNKSYFKSPKIRNRFTFFDFKNYYHVDVEYTPNPGSLKFSVDVELLPDDQSIDYCDAENASENLLAKKLFENRGVKRVFIGPKFITVTKSHDSNWSDLTESLKADIEEFLTSERSVVNDSIDVKSTTEILPEDSKTVAMIKEFLELKVRGTIREDGGDVAYLGYENGIVFIMLQGACSDCPSAKDTVKAGIERMMMHWIENVNGVIAVDSIGEYQQLLKELKSEEVKQ